MGCRRFCARKLLDEFPNKANILNTSYKELLAHLTQRLVLLLSNEILWRLTSKYAVCVVLVLTGSVETELGVKLVNFVTPLEHSFLFPLVETLQKSTKKYGSCGPKSGISVAVLGLGRTGHGLPTRSTGLATENWSLPVSRHTLTFLSFWPTISKQESPANAKGPRESSACMKAHCEQI